MMNTLSIIVFLTIAHEATSFVHPGIWLNQQDFDRMRTMIQANQTPWTTNANSIVNSANKNRASSASVNQTNAYDLQLGGENIMLLALAWVITGDVSYGNACRNDINEWSEYQRGGDSLRNGIGAGFLINAAEIIRYVSVNNVSIVWSASDIAAFEAMLTNYMLVTLEQLVTYGDGGWGTPSINAMASLGVFCDNDTL